MSQSEESHDMALSSLGKGLSTSSRFSPSTLPERDAKGKQLEVQTKKEAMKETEEDIKVTEITLPGPCPSGYRRLILLFYVFIQGLYDLEKAGIFFFRFFLGSFPSRILSGVFTVT
eukprot:TRINITY_DN2497_c0_g2_i1.p2 TRINITY_DN2497_c0_g2~~TRINITY_DN2497_c0_g2_i1.p2  ORF type:complete len:116 (+),score=11.08 TRINITY_DN2497_c0_g2_i1:624-971(+)